jgi:carbamoyl-phosphate synthase large subunit
VTPASFEPTLDYVAIKMPRFAFEKVPGASTELTTHMKSVGEVLAIGRTFREAFGKAMSARELDGRPAAPQTKADALALLRVPSWDRYDVMLRAVQLGASAAELSAASGVHEWFCEETVAWAEARSALPDTAQELDAEMLRRARKEGLTDRDIAIATGESEAEIGATRRRAGVVPTFHAVDTCAAEFVARTPYYYAAFDNAGEIAPDEREAIVVLGSGPNRIGQGIEFDYCCVHAAEAARDLGYAAIMVNCNPETVSTDHGVSDRLYMEPVTLDTVLDVCAQEEPLGVVTQLGGQTPLRLANQIEAAGVQVLGTPAESIDLAEDRGRFGALLDDLGLSAPPWAVAERPEDALAAAEHVGYPILVRPSYVLGGRAMQICDNAEQLRAYLEQERPSGVLLVDRFLEGALELDVDALSDGSSTWVAATMEHVEAAGVHSGDSACVLPPQGAGPGLVNELERQTGEIAHALGAVGLLNVQFAVRDGHVFVIEANPRASRTVPFVAKATGVPLVRHALRLMVGTPIGDLRLPPFQRLGHVAVKEAVLPFARFPGADPVLGPEMKATGEVMGLAGSFAEAFAKAQRGAGQALPREGAVFLSARDADKPEMVAVAARLAAGGLALVATEGTARAIAAAGLTVTSVRKISEGSPHVGELIGRGEIQLVLNTPSGRGTQTDGAEIRAAAVRAGIPCITTLEAAVAAAEAIRADARPPAPPIALQDIAAVADSGALAPSGHP